MADSNKFLNIASNYNRLFNNEIFIKQLITNIKNRLNRQLLQTEKMYIINLLKTINPVIFNKKNPTMILNIITEKVLEAISNTQCEEEEINIHEMLKAEIGVGTEDAPISSASNMNADTADTRQITSSFANQVEVSSVFGNKSFAEFQKVLSPASARKSAYIVLDTRYRILDDDGQNSIAWNFVSNVTYSQGTVNANSDIKDITSIKVFPIEMPYKVNNDNDYKMITMYIQEFSAQAFIAQENARFHFIFEPKIKDKYIKLSPKKNNDGVFRFRNPISRLETLTLSFGSPLQPILFDVDRLNMAITSYGSVTVFQSIRNHNISTGDLVYISGFNTDNPYPDTNVISMINAQYGNIITGIDDKTFSIDIDTTSLFSTGAGTISVTSGSQAVVGLGTNFTTIFNINDDIEILGNIYFIKNIMSDTLLNITIGFDDISYSGLNYYKNNTLVNLQISVYFGSKRMFIPMEIEYIDATETV